jgi:WXG100 family type VII secretion target
MTTYSVQFGAMQDANAGLTDVHNKLTNMVEDLNQQVNNGLVNFQGSTREQFFQVHQQYNQNHAALTDALHQANNALGNIHDTYLNAENRGTQMWS